MALRVFVGGLSDPARIRQAIALGASAVGLRLPRPDPACGDPPIDRPELRALAATVPPGISCWLELEPAAIGPGLERLRCDTLLLRGTLPPPEVGGLKRRHPWLRVVLAPASLSAARLAAAVADGLLLDATLAAALPPGPPRWVSGLRPDELPAWRDRAFGIDAGPFDPVRLGALVAAAG